MNIPLSSTNDENKENYQNWFEDVYIRTNQAGGVPPWAYQEPHPELVDWMEQERPHGAGKSALVIGCGLGDDAEYLARCGFAVTAFDISKTAIALCRQRFPESQVSYFVADLFDLSETWISGYDFVFESRTIQALPYEKHTHTIETIAQLVADEGILLVVCFGRDPDETVGSIPWPVSQKELATFRQFGFHETNFKENILTGRRNFRIMYQKTGRN